MHENRFMQHCGFAVTCYTPSNIFLHVAQLSLKPGFVHTLLWIQFCEKNWWNVNPPGGNKVILRDHSGFGLKQYGATLHLTSSLIGGACIQYDLWSCVNSLWIDFKKNLFDVSIICRHWDCTGMINPFSWMKNARSFFTSNTTHRVNNSILAIKLAKFFRTFPTPVQETLDQREMNT